MCCKLFSEDCAYGNCVDCISIDFEGLGGVESVPFYSWIQGEKYYSKQLKNIQALKLKENSLVCLLNFCCTTLLKEHKAKNAMLKLKH